MVQAENRCDSEQPSTVAGGAHLRKEAGLAIAGKSDRHYALQTMGNSGCGSVSLERGGLSPGEGKSILREAVLSARGRMAPREVVEKSTAIREAVAATAMFRRSESVSCYMALRAEVQTIPLIEVALGSGKRVAVPKVHAERGELGLYWVTSTSAGFAPGPYGILEPISEDAQEASVTDIDLFLVPGLAFDEGGWRVGFGKGYYDRLLARANREAHRVGLAFQLQIVPHCPHGRLDVPMHYVFTEERVIRCTQRA